MTRLRTHYDNLQVARTASAEVIRAAYRALSQKWHPDKHPGNRREAERVMRIVNHAYEVLSDPEKRRQHDRWIARVEREEARAPLELSPPGGDAGARPVRAAMDRAAGGYFRYRSLPEATRRRLKARIDGGAAGAAIGTSGVRRNYAWLVLLALGIWLLDELFRAGKWPPATRDLYLPMLLVGALSFAANASRIIRWHLSPLKCRIVLTPLHVVRTRFDEVWARPIWTLSDLEVSAKGRRGRRSKKTTLRFVFPEARERVTIRERKQAELFLAALQAFRAKIRGAVAEQDRGYFIEEDDFVGAEPRSRRRLRRAVPSATALLVYPAVVVGVLAASDLPERSSRLSGLSHLVRAPLEAAVSRLTRHPQPLPANGRERRYHRSVSLAPFEIRAHAGTGHYLVEVKDWSSGETVMSVFVREGQTVKTTLPVGSYRIEYANGDIWYGREHLFGPRTRFGHTERRLDVFETEEGFTGYTVELLPRADDGAGAGG